MNQEQPERPSPPIHRYFDVSIVRQYTGFFNLSVKRLHKAAENKRDGLSAVDQYLPCCEISGVSERDAQCIVMALEHPRERLKPGEEVRYWKSKLKGFVLKADGTFRKSE